VKAVEILRGRCIGGISINEDKSSMGHARDGFKL